jgi:putative DNA primase/helicase
MNEQKMNSPGDVLIAAGEDVPEFTISPRLRAMGADLSRVFYLYGREGKDNKEIPWTVNDIATLKDAIQQIKSGGGELKLFIIDPLENFIGGDVDVYRNNEVRAALRAIMDLAKEEKFTILAIQHLNKTTGAQALYRFAGSIAFAAAARTVWQVTKDKDKPFYLFANTKMNIAKQAPTYRYSIIDVDGIGIPAWDCIVETDAEAAMNGQGGREAPAQNEVLEIIRKKYPTAIKFSDIVETTGKNKSNISNILKELEKSGKIKKSDVLSGYYVYLPTEPEKEKLEIC